MEKTPLFFRITFFCDFKFFSPAGSSVRYVLKKIWRQYGPLCTYTRKISSSTVCRDIVRERISQSFYRIQTWPQLAKNVRQINKSRRFKTTSRRKRLTFFAPELKTRKPFATNGSSLDETLYFLNVWKFGSINRKRFHPLIIDNIWRAQIDRI